MSELLGVAMDLFMGRCFKFSSSVAACHLLNPVANPSKLQKTLRATKAPIKPTKARECLLLFIEGLSPTPHPGEQSSTEGAEIGLLSPKALSPQTPKP